MTNLDILIFSVFNVLTLQLLELLQLEEIMSNQTRGNAWPLMMLQT